MGNNERESKQSLCFQIYNYTCVLKCSCVVVVCYETTNDKQNHEENLTVLCAFSHKKSHFKCHKTHTLKPAAPVERGESKGRGAYWETTSLREAQEGNFRI